MRFMSVLRKSTTFLFMSGILAAMAHANQAAFNPPSFYDDLPTYYEVAPGTQFYVVEVEDLHHSSRWKKETELSGYSGSGYLRWGGPNQSCAKLGQPEGENHNDITGNCQGSPEDWLIIRIHVNQPGAYKTDIRGRHELDDGDNDHWFHLIGMDPHIVRVGVNGYKKWSFRNPDGPYPYSRDWWLKAGINEFYLAGRSPGARFDRIVIGLGETKVNQAKNLALPVSPTTAPTSTALKGQGRAELNLAPFISEGWDLRGRAQEHEKTPRLWIPLR